MRKTMAEIMTPKEVANYLRMGVLTVYKYAKQGTIPSFRIGTSWRFNKNKIDAALLIGQNISEIKENKK
jgi:excisionase family DNA binding protein